MVQTFLDKLAIPQSCELNKPIFKKLFLDNGNLDATDKRALKEDVDKIRWLYTLKPNTINIAKYEDENLEYMEIAILQIELTNPKRLKRISGFIQKAIPYPLVLIFSHDERFCLSVADKRINQADRQRWVVEDIWTTEWIDTLKPDEKQARFIEDCNIKNLSFTHFHAFYQDLKERVIALNAANHTGQYVLNGRTGAGTETRIEGLKEIERLELAKAELKNKLKKEKQMGRQVELNSRIKNINDQIQELRQTI
ncbi:hypothetical protein UZ36_07145 [Candidatus Nitromaritima sp. SCGC AAA799-C22]|nr:hypothetical protein UZ36_07145 [Candidatus Nitromaritima sp. SCGC AAA799-C22]